MITVDDLKHSPAWYPLETDHTVAQLVGLDERAYREASFLDQRLLRGNYARATVELPSLTAAAVQLQPRLHYVFHTGHVGSTLVSRLIGAQESYFSLREPSLLRAAAEPAQVRPDTAAAPLPLRTTLALLARTWRSSQRAVVKVTSFVSELADDILASSDQPAAIFMFADPAAYIGGILIGPNSRTESRVLAPARLGRLVKRLAPTQWRSDPRTEGEQVAMSWLCEMLALHVAAVRRPAQVLWVNFDTFLAAPLPGMQQIFHALGSDPPLQEIEALVSGPLMQQYSKAPEYAYDAALRREVLRSAAEEHSVEIRRGMEWLAQVATQHPPAQRVLELAERLRAPPNTSGT